jgi:hypothetical protein
MPPIAEGTDVQTLQDRLAITDVLNRYSSCVDAFDYEGLRSVLADDVHGQYGNAPAVEGGDALARWIEEATASIIWQHHQLSVYHVDVDGDDATALSYLTSHQVFREDPKAAKILVARYHDELRRTPSGWRISKRTMEVLWGESRPDDGYLDQLGGRGPAIWSRG